MLKFLTKAIIFLGVIVGAITFVYLYDLYQEIKDDIDSVVNYNPKQSTQFFDKNGKKCLQSLIYLFTFLFIFIFVLHNSFNTINHC